MKKDITRNLTYNMFLKSIERYEKDLLRAIKNEKEVDKNKDIMLYLLQAEKTHQIAMALNEIKFLLDCYIEDFNK